MSALSSTALFLGCALAGWWLVPETPAPELAPPAPAPVGRTAGNEKADPVKAAVAVYLRTADLLSRNPRDFRGEWEAGLNPETVLADWITADPDGFFVWFGERGIQEWQPEPGEVARVFSAQEARLLECLRSRRAFQSTWPGLAAQLVLALPPAEAVPLLAQYADFLGSAAGGDFLPENALEMLGAVQTGLPAGPARKALLTTLAKAAATQQPAAAGAWWSRQDGRTRALTAAAVLAGFSSVKTGMADCPMEALLTEAKRTTPAADLGDLARSWVAHLAETSPVDALVWAAASLPAAAFSNASGSVWDHWLASGPDVSEVAQALDRLPESARRMLAASGVQEEVITHYLFPLLKREPGSAGYRYALAALRDVETDTPAIREWIGQAPPGEVPDSLLQSVALSQATSEGGSCAAAFDWLRGLPDQPVLAGAEKVASSWFLSDASAASEAIALESPGILRHAGIRAAADWLDNSPAEAAEWLVSLPVTDRTSVLQAIDASHLSVPKSAELRQRIVTPDEH